MNYYIKKGLLSILILFVLLFSSCTSDERIDNRNDKPVVSEGLWAYEKIDENSGFRWTKPQARIVFLKERKPESIKVSCRYPFNSIKGVNTQTVRVFLNNKLFKKVIFTKHGDIRVPLSDGEREEIIRVEAEPFFNLKDAGIGEDSRNLGVMVSWKGMEKSYNNRRFRMNVEQKNFSLFQGETVFLGVSGFTPHTVSTSERYFFSYHVYDTSGKIVSYNNRRFNIPGSLKAGAEFSFTIKLYFDFPDPGRYKIFFDIVKEGEFWGSERGWFMPSAELELKGIEEYRIFTQNREAKYRDSILKELKILRLALKNCEKREKGKLLGFSAGSSYPGIWIRDNATLMKFASEFYTVKELTGIIDNFLRLQKRDGEIPGRFYRDGTTGKNTVETDQESSLLIASGSLPVTGKWLSSYINGVKVIERLDMALEWVWEKKRDKETGLIVSGFNVDWGDVEKTFSDIRATQLSEESELSVGIYTQALFIRAISVMRKFAEMNKDRALDKKWEERAEFLRKKTRALLFLKERGYFLVHIPLKDPDKYRFERDMLALGGNAEAALAGLMSAGEFKKFYSVYMQKLKEYRLDSICYVLLPPYEKGFFKHPALNPWEYQNGGAWDWIGARMLKAMYMYGLDKEADFRLNQIIRRHSKTYTVFEWEDRAGNGRGAFSYCGAAGVTGEVILQRREARSEAH